MATSALEGIRMYQGWKLHLIKYILQIQSKLCKIGEQQYRFYYGISLAFEGRVQESIRELDQCLVIKDLQIAALLALIYAHRKCQVVGQ